jgi:hypothetical protein
MKFLYIQEMALKMTGNASRFLAPEDTIIIMKIKYTRSRDSLGQSEEQNILLTDTISLSTYI